MQIIAIERMIGNRRKFGNSINPGIGIYTLIYIYPFGYFFSIDIIYGSPFETLY